MTQIICPISGISLIRAPYMLGLKNLVEVHPIFRMKRKDLVTDNLVHRFRESDNLEEKRLYFLGALYSTDLVTFECIARPSLYLCEKYFLQIVQVSGWLDYALYSIGKEISFPRFIVRIENEKMENIGGFLSAIDDVREDFLKKDKDKDRSRRLRVEHERLFKEFADAFKKDRFFTPSLARWIMKWTELEDHPKAEIFFDILTCKLKDAWGLDRRNLEELDTFFYENVDRQHPISAPLFGQFQQLLAAQRKGYNDFEIIEDEEKIDIETGISIRQSVQQSATEKLLEKTGSINEPIEKDFKERWRFLQAQALWRTTQINKKVETNV